MQVKICGITNLNDAMLCIECGTDALGFIFYKKSPRYISPKNAANIIANLPPFMTTVGVFVDHTLDEIMNTIHTTGLSMTQLHGTEEHEFINAIPVRSIKAFRVDDSFDFKVLNRYSNCKILLDTYRKTQHGGTGESFNWDVIPQKFREDIILAGGINLTNIHEVYQKIHPAAVDLSSSLEKTPGIKDENKVRLFFKLLKELEEKVDLENAE